MKKFYVVYSLECPSLSREELRALFEIEAPHAKVIAEAEGLVLFEAEVEDLQRMFSRSAYMLEYGELLSYGSVADAEKIIKKALAEVDIENPVLTVKSIKGCGKDFLSNFMKTFWTTSDKKREIVRVIVSEGLVAVGIPLVKLKFSKTVRPRAKTVTGAMDPRLSRALVNIARLRRGGIFLDPFCGTGNLAIEACGIGANRAICLDLDKSMCEASRDNSERSGTDECVKVVRGDARVMPLPNNSIDAIATDPPYGRSSSTRGERYDSLIEKFLRESLRMLKSEAHIVYLGPYESKPWLIAEKAGLILLKRLHLFVHRSLIREVVIARVP